MTKPKPSLKSFDVESFLERNRDDSKGLSADSSKIRLVRGLTGETHEGRIEELRYPDRSCSRSTRSNSC